MRKGTSLLLLASIALAGAACLSALWSAPVWAASLEPTDSGAPSAIVIFPVGEKPNPNGAAMPPVAFNHLVHEKWMTKAAKDCMVCHHTGDPVACTSCHTVEGSKDGKFVTLYKAMHAENTPKNGEFPPSSCISCHERQTTQRDCFGCHGQLVNNARQREKDSWCAVCHTIAPGMTKAQMQEGIAGKLPESKNEKIATETAAARKQVEYWSPMLAPYKVTIDSLEGEYEPAIFNHRQHVKTLMDRIKTNQLAGAFHTQPATICITCHHNSPPSVTPPKCASCHSKTIDKKNPDKPSLMAAFHLQCMSCHRDMKVARPRNTDCVTCHKPKPVQGAAK